MERRTTNARIFYNVANGAMFFWTTCPHFDLLTFGCRRKLNNSEKANYIKAIKCLQARPPLHRNIAAVKTRFDEFQALHINVADRVHTTVNFATTFINATGSKIYFLGLFLALASTIFEPLRKRPAWRVRLRRSYSVCDNIALKAIINIFISLQILGLDAGYRQFVSPFTQFVDRGRLISFLVFTTHLSSIRSLASVEMASLAHIPFRRIRPARPSFMTLNPLLDVWRMVPFTPTPFT